MNRRTDLMGWFCLALTLLTAWAMLATLGAP